jgi:hypothetical protein
MFPRSKFRDPRSAIKGGLLLAVKLRCNHCNKEKLPGEIATGNETRGRICYQCLNNHYRNLNDIAKNRPRRCNECRVHFDQLAERDPNATMTIQLKDGILQLLCKPCAKRYEPKTHVYKGTAYAHMKGYQAGVK